VGELRIHFDPVDQRCAAGCRGEQTLENDQIRTSLENGLERLDRLGISEGEKIPLARKLFTQRRNQVRGCNDGRRHSRQSITASGWDGGLQRVAPRPSLAAGGAAGRMTPRVFL
jgi:hypothetical protein